MFSECCIPYIFSDPSKNHIFKDITTNRCHSKFDVTLECLDDRDESMFIYSPSGHQAIGGCFLTSSEPDPHFQLNLPCSNSRMGVIIQDPYLNDTGNWECRIGSDSENSKYLWVDAGSY